MINWAARKKGGVWYPEAEAYFAIGLVNNVQRWPQDPYFPFSSLYNVVLHGVEVWKNPILSLLIPSSTLAREVFRGNSNNFIEV